MKCPKCGSLNDKVLETRQSKEGVVIKRRRECLNCGYRFTTYERIEEEYIEVIKKNNTVEPFNKEKIIRGILLASKNRPITQEQVRQIADDIEKYLLDEGKLKVSSAEIGDLVKNRLKELDPVSYLRFVSVFDGFEDIKDFEEFIKSFEKKNLDTKG
ncbi:transcriptional regulator NrdR [Sulfurihydrogenibium yellowstonense]|uniref:Transcriptional repressor NrdR n=1 Tax=Sulfurihydrogenibium yellowstonense SS-5 TaxID=432331 RepID=C4FL19_9AQUI|nr:transcriptional regulator NrdR [Sulfurihydrogenibium yellowstonense]EEP60233.1 transcriptional regulator NrdR [Sulfurihydrogenibium yellowstonense SS-5]